MTTQVSDLVATLLGDNRTIPSVATTPQLGTMAERIHRGTKYRFSLRKVLDAGLAATLADRSVDRYLAGKLKLPNDVVVFEVQENHERHFYVAWQAIDPAVGLTRIFLRYYVRTSSPSRPPGDFYTVPATGLLTCLPEQRTDGHSSPRYEDGMRLSDFVAMDPDLHLGRVSSEIGSNLCDDVGKSFDDVAEMLALMDLETTLKRVKQPSQRAGTTSSDIGARGDYECTMITTPDIHRTIGELKGWLDVLDLEIAEAR